MYLLPFLLVAGGVLIVSVSAAVLWVISLPDPWNGDHAIARRLRANKTSEM